MVKTCAIILAAGKSERMDASIPKSLLPIGNTTILERTISILKWCGINDITLVIGEKGKCWNKKSKSRMRKIADANKLTLVVNYENDTSQPAYSLYLAIKKFESTLVVDGDVIFRKELIKDLLTDKRENVLVSRAGKNISEKGGKLIFSRGCLKYAGLGLQESLFPWFIYSGIMKIDGSCLKAFVDLAKEKKQSNLLDILSLLCDTHTISNLFEFDIKDEKMLGGSGASIEKRLIVRKEAPKGNWKLEGQIRWLLQLPNDLKPYFPKVLCYDLKSNPIWYEMPYYNMPSLRELLFTGEIDSNEAVEFLHTVMKFMFSNVYSRNHRKVHNWVETRHIKRVETRLAETTDKVPLFDRIICASSIELNDKRYENVPSLIWKIKHTPRLMADLQPKYISMVHGDLHFQNILWDKKNEKVIYSDPRGDVEGSDFAYDLGKLWHCFDGLYDFMHEDLFTLKSKFVANIFCANLVFTHPSGVKVYKEIKNKFPSRIDSLCREKDPKWQMRAEFNNACHLSSVMPFHLKNDKKEERAVALYLTGTRLMNEFIDKYGGEYGFYKDKEVFINVNTPKDYQQAKRWIK